MLPCFLADEISRFPEQQSLSERLCAEKKLEPEELAESKLQKGMRHPASIEQSVPLADAWYEAQGLADKSAAMKLLVKSLPLEHYHEPNENVWLENQINREISNEYLFDSKQYRKRLQKPLFRMAIIVLILIVCVIVSAVLAWMLSDEDRDIAISAAVVLGILALIGIVWTFRLKSKVYERLNAYDMLVTESEHRGMDFNDSQ